VQDAFDVRVNRWHCGRHDLAQCRLTECPAVLGMRTTQQAISRARGRTDSSGWPGDFIDSVIDRVGEHTRGR